jgi:hypothetical protein
LTTIETGGFANVELNGQLAMQFDQIYELSANSAVRRGSTVDGYAIVDLSAAGRRMTAGASRCR